MDNVRIRLLGSGVFHLFLLQNCYIKIANMLQYKCK